MKILALAALAAAIVAAPAHAVTVSGDTSGGPTFNRPVAGNPPTVLSGAGTAVRYQVTAFTVSDAGDYHFVMDATGPTRWDNFLGLYAGGFDPADPLAGVIITNDDYPSFGLSGFVTTLATGTSYYAVATGYDADAFGAYTLTIDGAGAVLLSGGAGGVPEPGSWALMLAGFGLAGAALRATRRTTVRYA
ncbi:PEPxxWA-CTERM sorting domain-containing protein [Sphingomonas flavalba]|uniref:PEPxxWA-CTERM sorting domain-containing protein n=1 Tax=Sphingomonas flavalba TaxID=2559804 RepID=UPI0039E127DD